MIKVAVLFDRFGPYHIARLQAAENYVELFPIEIFGETSEYQWDKEKKNVFFNGVTLFEEKQNEQVSSKELKSAIDKHLDRIQPQVVAINGWHDRAALIATSWCMVNRIPAIVMSESAEEDIKRVWLKEFVKKQIVSCFSSGFVGGVRHANYLAKLEMPRKNIFFGYDVIDNGYFEKEAEEVRMKRDDWHKAKRLPENYFLVVSRFIQKKNLPFLINTYAEYHKIAGDKAWHLYMLGDGPEKDELKKLVNNLKLEDVVHLEGFKQYKELPIYFALAKAFVHVSTTEQWGLVVNEAMASGLPVIVSKNCGCVPELVKDEINGYAIDPNDQKALVDILLSFSNGTKDIKSMGHESKKIIASLNTDNFGKGLSDAAKAAITAGSKNFTIKKRLILKSLQQR